MKTSTKFCLPAGLFIFVINILAGMFLGSPGYCEYRFDDIQGPSGISNQWMIINNAGDTFGASHTTPINVSGDVITTDEALLNVLNGDSQTTVNDRSLHTFFLTAVNGTSEFTMNFRAPSLEQQFDVATPNLALSTMVNEDSTPYNDTKEPLGKPDNTTTFTYDDLWRGYNFNISRSDTQTYDTVAQYFYFQQNPNGLSSQGIPRPMIISNVNPGTATDEPLEMRLRDSASSLTGNIVAYDRFKWNVADNYTAYGNQWVFVPVDDLITDNRTINYYLTTEVANHCSYRYAAYNGNTTTWRVPDAWKFDLPRTAGLLGIENEFNLAPESHIAPGLVTVYRRAYNINESDKIPLRLFPIDDTRGTGVYNLVMNHSTIFGKRLGDTYKYAASEGGFNLFEITAFNFTPASFTFLDSVRAKTGSLKGSVAMPTTQLFTGSSIKRTASQIPSTALTYFTIDQQIPANLRTSLTEGMLPLHITFNIPITQLGADAWNAILREWRRSGSIVDTFNDYYNIYLLTTTDGQANPWNLSQHMENYPSQIKVFLDDQRGRITQDNDRGLITVSMIVMLMDGTRDGVRPELSVVSDTTNSQESEYIVIRDGKNDNKWLMTFYIAPSQEFINPDTTNNNNNNNNMSHESGGGGGCNAGFGIMIFAAVYAFMKRR